MSDAIPYTVIGGYLGAGKTTLLNNLLRHSQGLRLAVLVNDFGDINIDADLITSHDGETINLSSGCICCSLADGFLAALNQVSKRRGEIDHIVVEASGVADPLKIGQYGSILKLDLAGVIVLVDAAEIQSKAANKYVGETVVRQLKGADLLVLNKVDLISAEDRARVRGWLAEQAPGVRLVETAYGQAPLAVLLGYLAAPAQAGDQGQKAGGQAAERQEEDHADMYRTWSYVADEPVSRTRLQALLDSLPDGLLRAKGFVYLADDPARRYLLQLVGRRWKLTPGEVWTDLAPQTRLVFIGIHAG